MSHLLYLPHSPRIHHPFFPFTPYDSFKDVSTTVRLSDLLRLMLCSSEAMVLYDTEDRIVHTNKAYTRMTGYTLSDVEGKNNYSALQGPLTDVLAVQRCAVSCRKQEQVSSVTVTNYRKGKQTRASPPCDGVCGCEYFPSHMYPYHTIPLMICVTSSHL